MYDKDNKFDLKLIKIFRPPNHMAHKFYCNLDLLVIYVDKHFIYPVYILLSLILQNIHARIYKVHIHINTI
jgi:hypothetical protein